jgi:hypothetical protein
MSIVPGFQLDSPHPVGDKLGEGNDITAFRHPTNPDLVILKENRPGVLVARKDAYIAALGAVRQVNLSNISQNNLELVSPAPKTIEDQASQLVVEKAGGIPLTRSDLLKKFPKHPNFAQFISALVPVKVRIDALRLYYSYIDSLHEGTPPFALLDPKASALYYDGVGNKVWVIDPPNFAARSQKEAKYRDSTTFNSESLRETVINELLNPADLYTIRDIILSCPEIYDVEKIFHNEGRFFPQTANINRLEGPITRVLEEEIKIRSSKMSVEDQIFAINLSQPHKELGGTPSHYRSRLYTMLGGLVRPEQDKLKKDMRNERYATRLHRGINLSKKPEMGIYQLESRNTDYQPLNYLVISYVNNESDIQFRGNEIIPQSSNLGVLLNTEVWVALGGHHDVCVQKYSDAIGKKFSLGISLMKNDIATNLEINRMVQNTLT